MKPYCGCLLAVHRDWFCHTCPLMFRLGVPQLPDAPVACPLCGEDCVPATNISDGILVDGMAPGDLHHEFCAWYTPWEDAVFGGPEGPGAASTPAAGGGTTNKVVKPRSGAAELEARRKGSRKRAEREKVVGWTQRRPGYGPQACGCACHVVTEELWSHDRELTHSQACIDGTCQAGVVR